jgi:hypothetical protein
VLHTNEKTEMMVLIINNLHIVLYVREIGLSHFNTRTRSGDEKNENLQLTGEISLERISVVLSSIENMMIE